MFEEIAGLVKRKDKNIWMIIKRVPTVDKFCSFEMGNIFIFILRNYIDFIKIAK